MHATKGSYVVRVGGESDTRDELRELGANIKAKLTKQEISFKTRGSLKGFNRTQFGQTWEIIDS